MNLFCKFMCLFLFVHLQSAGHSEKLKKPASLFYGAPLYPYKSFYPSVATVQSTLSKKSALSSRKSLESLITIRYLFNHSDLNLLVADCYDTRLSAKNSDVVVHPWQSLLWNRSAQSLDNVTMQLGFQFLAQYPISSQDDRYALHGAPIYYQCNQNKITGDIEIQQDQGINQVVAKYRPVGKNLIDLYFLKKGKNRIAIVPK